MTQTTNNMEAGTNAVQFLGGQIGKYFGGPFGQAYANLITGQPGLVASLADLFAKIEDGTATSAEVADALYDVASITAGVGVLAGLAAPWVLTAVGVAGLAILVSKKYPVARDAIDKAINDGMAHPRTPSELGDPNSLGGSIIFDDYGNVRIDPQCKANWDAAQRFVPKKDPLTLDLNNNGIETTAPNATNPILFDHEGDGVKTGTGWIAPSDGFLALDRNGNGVIDNGTELFGDSTPIFDADGTVTGKAADGFDALAQQDSNADGVVNAQDANFAALRVWQDLNQDGISQSNELKTLTELGIAGINVTKTEHSQILSSGNEIADLGTFIRTDGTLGSAGVASHLADVNLASDTFHRSFTDVIPVTVQTAVLPDMQGSGTVRDLREAASLTTAEGTTFANALSQFATATTRNAQRGQLDALLTDR